MNFYKRFLGDYARDTAHLSLTEHGAYNLLLDAYYGTGRPLPLDTESLCRICRASTPLERRAVESVANQFFKVADDGLRHNPRADREIEAHTEQAEINKAIAINRETTRKTNRGTNRDTTSSTDGSPSHSQSHKKKNLSGFQPPDWVPADAWGAYVEMREKIKKPLTPFAAKLAVKKLDEFRADGMEPGAVLEQSVFGSWQGLFPLKNKQSRGAFPL